jgi:hypothetical protein
MQDDKEGATASHNVKVAFDAIKKSDKEAMELIAKAQRERDFARAEEIKMTEGSKHMDDSVNKAIRKAKDKQAKAEAVVREVEERAEKEIAKFDDPKRGDITEDERADR